MSQKKEKNALFSGDASFNEEAVIESHDVSVLDMESMKPQPKSEPEQFSLYSKSKKSGFDLNKLNPKLHKKYYDDNRFVRGVFLNHETPNGNLEFIMGPYDEIQIHVMQDGATYTVRKYVADHLNKNCKITKYSDTPVEIAPGQRKYVPMLSGGTARCSFIIEEFVD